MTTSRMLGGSRISARDHAPSVDLEKLAEFVSNSIESSGTAGPEGMPLASITGSKIRLNIGGVLLRMLKHPDFSTAFDPGEKSGFLRDTELPPLGMTAKMGGRLVHGTEATTAKAISALRDAVAKELDRGLEGFDITSLIGADLQSTLKTMARSIGTSLPEMPQVATMVPVQFAEANRPPAEREQDIGRVLSGIETVDGRDWLQLVLSGIEHKLQNDGQQQDDIDEIVTAIRTQSSRPGSQIRSFFEFLEDEAMARVRLQVCLRIMSAVAAQSNKEGLKSYVRRVRECFDAFAGAEGEPLTLEVGSVYGIANNTELAEQLRKAMFYGCLPVWAEGSVQLFERRIDPMHNQPTLREVSYRFRVNGNNPTTGKPALDSRLDKIFTRMVEEPSATGNIKRSLAELVFLSLVIPSTLTDNNSGSVTAEATAIAAELKVNPVATLKRLHDTLLARRHVMDELAGELIRVLKSKSASLVTAANRAAEKLMVSVHREVVDWAVVKGMNSPNEDILVKPEAGPNSIAWFHHIRVSERPWPGSIASISVETQLQERSLATAGEAQELRMVKSLTSPVLPVRLVPYAWSKAESRWAPAIPMLQVLDAGRGIEVEYDLRLLTLKKTKDHEKARSEQYRTAMVASAGLLIYVALWELVQRVKAHAPNLTMTLLRLQQTGKKGNREDDSHDGNTAIYAISQAIEKALTRELPVKLQGLTTENDERDTVRWKNRGALAALLGGQPVQFEKQGTLDKVAVVTYLTRPCDVHPTFPEADGYLFVSRTYIADSQDGRTELRVDQMLSRLVETRKDFHTPHLILEEIARLQKAGYRHILMLSHHFGNRHIGRTAERHAPHATLEFLDEAAMRFPEVCLYPLRRDVFPATRLRKRLALESGFEVLRYDAHQKMYQENAVDILRSLLPIYTFATLHVVADKGRPQSGFCTYFFDAEHRLSNFVLKESVRANILGTGEAQNVRQSLVSVLRGIHFMESEKPSDKNRLLPVLDPFDWATPTTNAAAGEVEVMSRRGGRSILLSMPALLAHVTKVLHTKELDSE